MNIEIIQRWEGVQCVGECDFILILMLREIDHLQSELINSLGEYDMRGKINSEIKTNLGKIWTYNILSEVGRNNDIRENLIGWYLDNTLDGTA